MSWNSRLTLLLVATVALAGSLIAPAAAETQQSVDVIVVLDDAANPSEVAREHRVTPRHLYDVALTGFSASVPEGRLVGLRNDPRVAYISNDGTVREAETVPTGVSRIEAPKAHAGATGSGIRTAIIDTGIDSDHPDLQANLDWGSGYDCVNKDADPEDDRGHGTHVAGTVAAVDNDQGVIGTAPAAQLVAFKVLDSTGSGSWSNVICGLDEAAALNADADPTNDIHIANMSLSGSGSASGSCKFTTSALYQAVCGAIDAGIAITVAAGNNSLNAAGYIPAAYPEVITVSAYRDTNGSETDAGCTTTCDEEFASFSNYGDIIDVIAPGAGIRSTTYDGRYGSKSGTSMAAPHVAGVAALVLQHTAFTPAQLEAHLRGTGQCPDNLQNQGTGNCTDQGAWDRDGDSVTEPMVNALWAAGGAVDEPDAAPTVTVTSPADGSTVTGTVSLTADAADDAGVSQVEFLVDATSIAVDADGSDGWSVSWDSTAVADGLHTVSATVTDTAQQTATSAVSVTVDNVADSAIALSATGYKIKGKQHADLAWSGATTVKVDVYRDGTLLTSTANDGFHTDNINRNGGGSYTYKVCEAGTAVCSGTVNVIF